MSDIQHHPGFRMAILVFQLVPGPGARAIPGATARGAFAVSHTNPKGVMFFMAFFPLFLGADSGALTLGITGFGLRLAPDSR